MQRSIQHVIHKKKDKKEERKERERDRQTERQMEREREREVKNILGFSWCPTSLTGSSALFQTGSPSSRKCLTDHRLIGKKQGSSLKTDRNATYGNT